MRETIILPQTKLPEVDQVTLHFKAGLPSPAQMLTRATDDSEFIVNTIDVLVLTQPDGTGDFVFQYTTVGRHLDQRSNTELDFEAYLTPSADPVKLMVVANCPDGMLDVLTEPEASELTEDNIRTELAASINEYAIINIPMTGVTQVASIPAATDEIRVPLMRSLAKATVALDLNAGSPSFELLGAKIWRMSDVWQLFPASAAVENETTVPMPTAPSVSEATGRVENSSMMDIYANGVFLGYMTETAAAASSSADDADAATMNACIVVEGRFADDATPSYYRIDFGKEGNAENPLGQVLRNYWYQFTIVGVEGSGWSSPQDAATQPASGLRTSVTPWQGGSNTDYYFGDNRYIKLSADSMLLDAIVDHTATMTITTSTEPFTINSTRRPGAGSLDIAGPSTQTITTDKVSITMRSIPADLPGEQKWEITATALTDESTEDYLEMHAADDMLTIYIKIARNPPPIPPEPPTNDPTKRTIRVYSLGLNTYGSLNLSTSSGMTAILRNTNYFGPSGSVPCAGIEFLGVGTPTGQALVDLLANVDIITTAYDYSPDAATCSIIYEWMQQPGHVAFLTSDNALTIDELRPMLDANMIWRPYTDLDNATYGYGPEYEGLVPATATEANAPFLDGVFGSAHTCGTRDATPYDTVTLFMNITGADTRDNLVPLIVATGSNGPNNNIMMMGIDPGRRIVYIGEVLWFHRLYTWWTNTVPYDASDYINVVFSNSWAWAVDKVMTENYDVPGMTDKE